MGLDLLSWFCENSLGNQAAEKLAMRMELKFSANAPSIQNGTAWLLESSPGNVPGLRIGRAELCVRLRGDPSRAKERAQDDDSDGDAKDQADTLLAREVIHGHGIFE
jgi:hypothetical protein